MQNYFVKKLQSLKLILFFLEDKKRELIGLFMISVMFSLISLFNVALLYPIINFSLQKKSDDLISKFLFDILGISRINGFISLLIVFILASLITAVLEIMTVRITQKVIVKIIGETEERVVNKLLNIDYSFFVDNKQGELIYSGINSPQGTAWVIQGIVDLMSDTLRVIVFGFFLFKVSYQTTITMIIIGIIYSLFLKKIVSKKVYTSTNNRVLRKKDKNVVLNELITGIKTVKVYDKEKIWEDKYKKILNSELQSYYDMILWQRIPTISLTLMLFIMISSSGIILYQLNKGDVTLFMPIFTVLALSIYRLMPALQGMITRIMVITQYFPDLVIIYNILNLKKINVASGILELKSFQKDLVFKKIYFHYSEMSNNIFNDFNLKIKKNEMTAVVGESGSGKSTLVNLILRLYDVNKGSIEIDGINIKEYNEKSILRKIGYVGQKVFLVNDTIKNNISFGLENINDDEIENACKLANAHEFIINLEDGYDSFVGDSGMKLSGGQAQRIAIARAILLKPEILILDEATSALDNISEKLIQDSINNMSKNTTIIVIAHRLSTIVNADKIVVLRDGKLLEEGTHIELLENKGYYHQLYLKENKK